MPRPRSSLRPLATLLVACAFAPGAAEAQEPTRTGALAASPAPLSDFGLRGAAPVAPASADPVTGPILPADRVAAAARSRAAAPGSGRNPIRSGRKPTASVVRPPLRQPGGATQTTATIQQPVLGLPDPSPPVAAPLARKRLPETDAYAPLGLRFGGLTVFPVIGQGIGYDSNPDRSFIRKGSLFSQTEGEVRLQSDWSRHELTGALRGAYNDYPDLKEANRPEGAGRVNLRLDASRDTQIDIEGRYAIDTQRPGSPELGVSVRDRPLVLSEGASAGVTQRFNRFSIGLKGSFDRVDYDDATLSSGTVLDQSFRNLNQYGVALRASYELKPGFVPFVEVLADHRSYDSRQDDAGYRRDSDAGGVRAGTTFEVSRLVTGEIAAGWQSRSYEDPRLRDLDGPLAEASVIWAITPLTTLRINGQTRLDETTVVGASGIFTARGTAEIQHDLRRNLTLTAGLSFADYDYRGAPIRERSLAANVRAEYRLTRQIAVRASYTHEHLSSNLPASDYTADVFLVGLRLQP